MLQPLLSSLYCKDEARTSSRLAWLNTGNRGKQLAWLCPEFKTTSVCKFDIHFFSVSCGFTGSLCVVSH